jgi:GxxExxY protein
MPESNLARADITREIIGAFFTVYNRLGHGFVESNYAEALAAHLRAAGRHVAREYATKVYYQDVVIGVHRLDMVVDLKVVVEIKSTPVLAAYARRQLYNYLRATNLDVGLLLHFGPKPSYQRLYVPNRSAPAPDR